MKIFHLFIFVYLIVLISMGCESVTSIPDREKNNSNTRTATLYNEIIEGEGIITPTVIREGASGGSCGLLLGSQAEFAAYFKLETEGNYTIRVTYSNIKNPEFQEESIEIKVNDMIVDHLYAENTGCDEDNQPLFIPYECSNPVYFDSDMIHYMTIVYSGGDGLEIDYIDLVKID